MAHSSSATRMKCAFSRVSSIGTPRPMHCDIVTAISPGVIEAVGGNVSDSVTKTRYAADPGGLLGPRQQRLRHPEIGRAHV